MRYLGRWGSGAVRLYTAQAYAEIYAQISADAAARVGATRRRLDQELWSIIEEVRESPAAADTAPGAAVVQELMEEAVAEAAQMEEEVEAAELAGQEPPGGGRFVTNRSSGVTHAGWLWSRVSRGHNEGAEPE